jgi:circadian clock protein KaiC
VLLLDDRTSDITDLQLQSLAHGVVTLENMVPFYGAERRRLRVVKYRGRAFRGGYHDFVIRRGGIEVFPRLVAAEHLRAFDQEPASSGVATLDRLSGGGLDRGTSALLMGPAGSGKSTVATHYMQAAAERGENVAAFLFDESPERLVRRAEGLGLGVERHVAKGRIRLQQIDPAELSPGEFAHTVRHAVEVAGARIVLIDSLNGYLQAMPEERFLIIQLHELLTCLGQLGVVTILVVAEHGLIGSRTEAPVDASYLADTVFLFRYYETNGALHRAISMVKKRSGKHENTVRELTLGPSGVQLGEPLERLEGVLAGISRPAP